MEKKTRYFFIRSLFWFSAVATISAASGCGSSSSNGGGSPATSTPAPAPTPLHKWTFDTDFNDSGSSATAWDGTASGSTSTLETTTVKLGTGSSYYSNSNTSYVNLGAQSLPSEMTLTFWVNLNSVNLDTVFANSASSSTTDGLRIFFDSSRILTVETGNATTTSMVTASTAVTNGTWTFVAITINRTDGTSRIYINGSLDKSGTLLTDFQTTSNVFIGRMADGHPFSGYLDDMRIFQGVLTADEVTAVYTNP